MKAEVHWWMQILSPDFFYTGIKWVVYNRDEYFSHYGYYMYDRGFVDYFLLFWLPM
jgi:hypothetical protein